MRREFVLQSLRKSRSRKLQSRFVPESIDACMHVRGAQDDWMLATAAEARDVIELDIPGWSRDAFDALVTCSPDHPLDFVPRGQQQLGEL